MSTPQKYKSGFDYGSIMDGLQSTKKQKVEKVVRRKANVFATLDDLCDEYFFTTKEAKSVIRDWIEDRNSDYDSTDTEEEIGADDIDDVISQPECCEEEKKD